MYLLNSIFLVRIDVIHFVSIHINVQIFWEISSNMRRHYKQLHGGISNFDSNK